MNASDMEQQVRLICLSLLLWLKAVTQLLMAVRQAFVSRVLVER